MKKLIRAVFGACGALLMFFVAAEFFLFIYGARYTADFTEDAVIVLGSGIRTEEISPALKARLDAALLYLSKNPRALVLTSGGKGSFGAQAEAQIMKSYLTQNGIAEKQILLEDKSKNTAENIEFSKKILDAHFTGPYRAAVISSRYHLFRARSAGLKAGIPLTYFGSPTRLSKVPVEYTREVLAVINAAL